METAAFSLEERKEDGELPAILRNLLETNIYRKFSGDESFIAKSGEPSMLDAGNGLGMVVEGKKKTGGLMSPSRL